MHALFLKRIQNGFRVPVFISLIKSQIEGLCILSNEKRMVIPILLLRTDCIVRAVVRIGVASQPQLCTVVSSPSSAIVCTAAFPPAAL